MKDARTKDTFQEKKSLQSLLCFSVFLFKD